MCNIHSMDIFIKGANRRDCTIDGSLAQPCTIGGSAILLALGVREPHNILSDIIPADLTKAESLTTTLAPGNKLRHIAHIVTHRQRRVTAFSGDVVAKKLYNLPVLHL